MDFNKFNHDVTNSAFPVIFIKLRHHFLSSFLNWNIFPQLSPTIKLAQLYHLISHIFISFWVTAAETFSSCITLYTHRWYMCIFKIFEPFLNFLATIERYCIFFFRSKALHNAQLIYYHLITCIYILKTIS